MASANEEEMYFLALSDSENEEDEEPDFEKAPVFQQEIEDIPYV